MKALLIILGIIAFFVILLHFSLTVIVDADNKEGVRLKIKYFGFTLYPRTPKNKKRKKRKDSDESADTAESDEETLPAPYADEEDLTAELEALDNEDFDNLDETQPEDESDTPPEESADKPSETTASEERKKDKKAKKAKKKKEKKDKSADSGGSDSSGSRGGLGGIMDKFNYYKPLIPMGWKYFKKLLKAVRFYDTRIGLVTAKPDAYDSAMFYGKLQIAVNNVLALLCRIFTVRIKAVDIKCEFNDDKLDYGVHTKVRVRPSTLIAIVVCVGVNYLKFRLKAKKKSKQNEKEKSEITDNEEVKKSA